LEGARPAVRTDRNRCITTLVIRNMNATTTTGNSPRLSPAYRPVIEQLSRTFPDFSHPEIVQAVEGALRLLEISSSRLTLYEAASLLLRGTLQGNTH
jgi:hypothetical protein